MAKRKTERKPRDKPRRKRKSPWKVCPDCKDKYMGDIKAHQATCKSGATNEPTNELKDFRDAEYEEIKNNDLVKQSLLDGKLQVVNGGKPYLVRVSEIHLGPTLQIGAKILDKKRIYKIV